MKKIKLFIKNHIYLTFTVIFAICSFLVFFEYIKNGKTFISTSDSLYQHYPALIYYGSYLRDVLKTIFIDHSLSIPTWDMSLGYGGDIISTLNFYCIGDPLCLFSVFFNENTMDIFYSALVIIRIYLAGISFIAFSRFFNLNKAGIILGALVYCFCGYATIPGVFHPFFTIPMIYLPLLWLGVEHIYSSNKPALFIAAVGLSAVSNFYFFYMLVIMTVIYTIVRYFSYNKKLELVPCIKKVGAFLGYAVIGVAISLPTTLPSISSLLSSDRFSAAKEIICLYPVEYYKAFPAALITNQASYYFYVSVSSIAMLGVISLFVVAERKYRPLKLGFIGMLIASMLPWAASALNGFSYVANRWIWAFCFLISFIFAVSFPLMRSLTKKQLVWVSLLTSFYVFLCLIPEATRQKNVFIACIIMLLGVSSIFIFKVFKKQTIYNTIAISALTIISIVYNGFYWANADHMNWEGRCFSFGEAYSTYTSSAENKITGLSGADTNRYSHTLSLTNYNSAMLFDINGTDYYFSAINAGTSSFQRSQLLSASIAQQYSGIDDRAYLASALSVKYYLANENNKNAVPYGYKESNTEDGITVYEGVANLPLVYAFDEVCTSYVEHSVEERQQMLLQCAMTESAMGLPEAQPVFDWEELDYEISLSSGIEMTEDGFDVKEGGAYIILDFKNVSAAEVYVTLENIYFKPYENETECKIVARCGNVTKPIYYKTPANSYYCGYNDFLFNLGYDVNARSQATVLFANAGVYSFSEIKCSAQYFNNFDEQAEKLRNSGISNISVNGDNISFTSSRTQSGIACIAVPFEKGWNATIDGKKTEIIEIQDGLCGIALPEGEHVVAMNYHTPFLNISLILSAAGLLTLAWLFYNQSLPNKKKK